MASLTDSKKTLRGLLGGDLIKTNELLFILAEVLNSECQKE